MKYWIPTITWMSLIFVLSSRSRVQVSDIYAVQFIFFKTLHIIEYAILYLLMYRSLRNSQNLPQWKNLYNAWLFSVVYGITDEIHQMFVPSREGTIRDMFIDSIGITLAAIYIWKYLPKAPKKLKIWAKKLQLI